MYNVGTVTTTANSTKLVGVGTKWKDNNSRVSAEQVILIQNGATIYINSIASIQSNTEITLSFPVPASVSNAPYQILTTMVNSVSDAANKIVAMNVSNVQFSDILNRWATESGTITVTLPDGTTQQLRTAKEMDKQLDGKFDKAGGAISGDVTFSKNAIKSTKGTHTLPAESGTLMQVGDYGWGGYGKPKKIETDEEFLAIANERKSQIFATSAKNNYQFRYSPTLLMAAHDAWASISVGYSSGNVMVASSMIGEQSTINALYGTSNTTVDSNGNLKVASPIVKVFSDHIETNDESEGATMEYLGVGHYLIKGVVGFNADGAWGINNGIVIPQDHNGKNMILVDYDVKKDGNIELFVFHQQNADMPERFQNKRIKDFDKDGNPIYFENYEPCDIPEGRWIDMRVEMPEDSIYKLKQAEAERLAKEEADRQAEEEAKNAEIEAEEDI
ncbi:cell envelope integrity protein TolA [Providencia sp. PROV133]|uniref:cell envelope integrity protein TolA n=1 Tax=Providencia sp. PROV133 TaxID=2949843 RepID=UPI00234BE8B7|nr:cell envelope integrity protein TolA [Providencia sp. PROV133]